MHDPLADVVDLLRPQARFFKRSSAAGRWAVHRAEPRKPFYCALLEGQARLVVDDAQPVLLKAGDFILIPSASRFTMSSLVAPKGKRDSPHVVLADGEFRLGDPDAPADVRMLVGYCVFESPDAGLLLTLLPKLIHVREQPRLSVLVELVGDESRQSRPAREIVLAKLLEVLMIEALRAAADTSAARGLVRGLADERLITALRRIHENPTHAWTVAELARAAGLSRSAFFERFNRTVGVSPMEYVVGWRMALAKDLLRRKPIRVGEVAQQVGYSSASTFSVAFTRHVGQPPGTFAREHRV